MLLYVTIGTNDLARAGRFYAPVLAVLDLLRLREDATEHGYAPKGAPKEGQAIGASCCVWVTQPFDGQPATRGNGSMTALAAASNAQVDAFYKAALANGGSDEGKPGYRYRPGFYSCYVRDPDGNKLSAVCENAL